MTNRTDASSKTAKLRAAAERALAEAANRRREAETPAEPRTKEIGGVEGPEPTRFGDWEKKGRAYDF